MSNYNSLKATIDANIKTNGNQKVTGQILNSILNQIVNTLGTGYQFVGIATTETNPGTPDAKVFYIAKGKGTYNNFAGLVIAEDEVVILYWDTAWRKMSTGIASHAKLIELDGKKQNVLTFDSTPTLLSKNPVTSNGIREALDVQKSEVDAAKEEALQAIGNTEQSAITNFNAQRVTPEMLSAEVLQLINASGGGTITNLPDGEDLTTESISQSGGVIKFANRKFNPVNFSGKGYCILRKNIQYGKNILEQSYISETNTIYVIRYDFDLNGVEVSIPDNCVLQFEGGSFSNGTLICNNTEIIGTLSCFEKNLILDGTINGNEVKFDWWKCEKSTLEEYNLFINGNNNKFGVAPQISDTNRVILNNHIAKYIINFGLGIYPFDDEIEINNTNFRIKGIDSSKTLIWCPYSSFLYRSGGGAVYPFIKNISIESLKNVLYTQGGTKINPIHGLVIDYSKCISYTEHTFYNDATINGGIYGSKISFSQFYAGRDKGCFTNYGNHSNIYNNVTDAFQYFNNENPSYKGIMRCLFWNSSVFELRESNILYCGMKYVAYYDNEASSYYSFNARKCVFEGAAQFEVAGEKKGFVNIIKCDSTYGDIANFIVNIEGCRLVNNHFDESVAINLNGSVTNFIANIQSEFYIYGAYNLFNTGENIIYAISVYLDQGQTKRRLYIYNNTGDTSALKKATLIRYSKDTANLLNVPTTLISKCEELGNIYYIELAANAIKKNSPIFLPDKNINLFDGALVRENDYLKYQVGSNVYKIICSKANSYVVSSYNDYITYFKAGYNNSCFIIVGDIDLNGETINVRTGITFLFLGGSINNGIISSQQNTKFVNFSGTATFNLSTDYGPFANKPQNPYKGQKYFCTDKQTTEGINNGIPIYYNGTNWVDSLGRVVE